MINKNILHKIIDKIAHKKWRNKWLNMHKELDNKIISYWTNDSYFMCVKYTSDRDRKDYDFKYLLLNGIMHCKYCNEFVGGILINYRKTEPTEIKSFKNTMCNQCKKKLYHK